MVLYVSLIRRSLVKLEKMAPKDVNDFMILFYRQLKKLNIKHTFICTREIGEHSKMLHIHALMILYNDDDYFILEDFVESIRSKKHMIVMTQLNEAPKPYDYLNYMLSDYGIVEKKLYWLSPHNGAQYDEEAKQYIHFYTNDKDLDLYNNLYNGLDKDVREKLNYIYNIVEKKLIINQEFNTLEKLIKKHDV